MKKKENVEYRYSVKEGNPTKEERLTALLEGKVIKVVSYRTDYYKLDKYHRLCFSTTGHENSYQPLYKGYDYSNVLYDIDYPSWNINRIQIL